MVVDSSVAAAAYTAVSWHFVADYPGRCRKKAGEFGQVLHNFRKLHAISTHIKMEYKLVDVSTGGSHCDFPVAKFT